VAVLPAKEREVIVLYYLEQRPLADVAAVLGVSPNAASVRMHRGRRRLRQALADLGED
jgi:RNA polymerase sigma-70 factor (ECF subfamily)